MSPKEEISAEFGREAKDVQELMDAMDSPGFYHRNAVPERASEVPDKTEEGEGAGGGNQKPKPANPKAKTKAKAKPGAKAKAKSKASKDIPFFCCNVFPAAFGSQNFARTSWRRCQRVKTWSRFAVTGSRL